jgi:hypothetical protein
MANNLTVGLSRPMPGYQRPDPDVTATPIKAPTRQRFSTAAPIGSEPTAKSTPIALAHKQIEEALTAFENAWGDIAAAEQRGELTPDGRAAAVADASQSGAVDAAIAQAATRAEKADADYREARAGLSPQSNDVAAQLRADAFWRRVSRELDGIASKRVTAVTQRLIADADGPELGTLSVELGPYLRSRHLPDDWLPTALEAASPALKTAAAQRKLATQAVQIVAANGRAAKRAMASAGNGSYKRPALTHPGRYDPDA